MRSVHLAGANLKHHSKPSKTKTHSNPFQHENPGTTASLPKDAKGRKRNDAAARQQQRLERKRWQRDAPACGIPVEAVVTDASAAGAGATPTVHAEACTQISPQDVRDNCEIRSADPCARIPTWSSGKTSRAAVVRERRATIVADGDVTERPDGRVGVGASKRVEQRVHKAERWQTYVA